MSALLESARRDWREGAERLRVASRDVATAERLEVQVGAVTAELRRRLGAIFTLEELAATYADSEAWVRAAVEENGATPGWPSTLTVAADSAFHVYSRGAQDYTP